MSKSFYTATYSWYIYAISGKDRDGEAIVYIGKTKTLNLRKVLSYHRRKGKLTSEFFRSNSAPDIHLLQCLATTEAVAYKHCVAWIRYLLDSEYDVICPLGSYEDAYDLHPETQQILDEIADKDVSQLLSVPYSLSTEKGKVPAPVLTTDSVRLSIRIRPKEHNAFTQFCADKGFTQREGFIALLSLIDTADVSRILIHEQARTISRLHEDVSRLKKTPRGINADHRLKDVLTFAQQMIIQYITYLFSDLSSEGSAPCYSWEQGCRVLSNHRDYYYPTETCFFLFRFEHMHYGQSRRNNAPIFLYGEDITHSTNVLLRYYAKPEFFGIRPPHSPFYCSGRFFLIGCRVTDGAADMLAALPIPYTDNYETNSSSDATSLDDILSNAAKRSCLPPDAGFR